MARINCSNWCIDEHATTFESNEGRELRGVTTFAHIQTISLGCTFFLLLFDLILLFSRNKRHDDGNNCTPTFHDHPDVAWERTDDDAAGGVQTSFIFQAAGMKDKGTERYCCKYGRDDKKCKLRFFFTFPRRCLFLDLRETEWEVKPERIHQTQTTIEGKTYTFQDTQKDREVLPTKKRQKNLEDFGYVNCIWMNLSPSLSTLLMFAPSCLLFSLNEFSFFLLCFYPSQIANSRGRHTHAGRNHLKIPHAKTKNYAKETPRRQAVLRRSNTRRQKIWLLLLLASNVGKDHIPLTKRRRIGKQYRN